MKDFLTILYFAWLISLTIAVCVVDNHLTILAKRVLAESYATSVLTEKVMQ